MGSLIQIYIEKAKTEWMDAIVRNLIFITINEKAG